MAMDLRIKHIETHLAAESDDDQLEDTENTISTLPKPIPKQISPQQSVSSFPPMRRAFMRLEEENSGDSLRIEDPRHQSVEGVRSNAPALLYVEPMKRKWAPKCDSSLQQTKRSKY